MSAKAVRTITISGIGTFEVVAAPIRGDKTVKEQDVTTFADADEAVVAHPQKKNEAIKLKLAYVGTEPTLGATATYAATTTYTDGTTESQSVSGFVSKVGYPQIETGGDRKSTIDVEFTPAGGGTTTSTTAATTTTAG